jgi:predicted RNA binding protein YcfA (HicA-like mRNA interferase family)
MTQQQIEKKLKKSGWIIIHGKAHNLANNPAKPGIKIPIPRHKGDIPLGTAKAILKAAGIE